MRSRQRQVVAWDTVLPAPIEPEPVVDPDLSIPMCSSGYTSFVLTVSRPATLVTVADSIEMTVHCVKPMVLYNHGSDTAEIII